MITCAKDTQRRQREVVGDPRCAERESLVVCGGNLGAREDMNGISSGGRVTVLQPGAAGRWRRAVYWRSAGSQSYAMNKDIAEDLIASLAYA